MGSAFTTISRVEKWRERCRERCLSLVLLFQALIMFLIGPLVGTGGLDGRWLTGGLLILASISLCAARGNAATIAIAAGFAAMLCSWAVEAFIAAGEWSFAVRVGGSLLFILMMTWVMAHAVFSAGRVTLHKIRGAIVVYLNLALTFAFFYDIAVYHFPQAFRMPPDETAATMSDLIYFSLSTLTTTGFGDLAPVHPLVRSLANLEAVIGQLFPATLIASLIGHLVSSRREEAAATDAPADRRLPESAAWPTAPSARSSAGGWNRPPRASRK